MKTLASCYYEEYFPFQHLFENTTAILSPNELDKDSVLVLWGGGDISPSLYNRAVGKRTGASAKLSHRDFIEWNCLTRAVELEIPVIGICRGAQMLCAKAGGILIQHVEGHAGPNHFITTSNGDELMVNSLHHQMMHPEGVDHELLAWSKGNRSQIHLDVDADIPVEKEPELVLFPQIKGIAAQWHPEMMQTADTPSTRYLFDVIRPFLA